MSVRLHKGYWTIFSGEQPVISCASLKRALAFMRNPA